jgi:TonB-dependent receptor
MIVNIKSIDLIANGISADQIKKSQDSDAAEVIRRVPGITLADGKFVIVRGLSERYNSVLLNGSPAPSFEATKRAFSFDAIPSGMIESIMIYKSPAPELPADFAGACIEIMTKEVADKNEFKISYSSGLVQNTTFSKDFQKYQGGKYDILGFDDGTRDFPKELPSKEKMDELYKWPNTTTYYARMDSLQTISRSFNKNWDTHAINPFLDQNIAATLQRRFIAGGVSIGNITSLNYKITNNYNLIRRAEYYSYDEVNDNVSYAYDFTDKTYVQEASIGLVHNWLFIFGNNQKIGFRNLLNNLGENKTVQRNGIDAYNSQDVLGTNLKFNQRFIYSGQVEGKHHINNNSTRFNWNSGFSYTSNNDPDNRRFTYTRPINSPDSIPYAYVVDNKPSVYYGGRLTQNLVERDYNLKFDLTQDIYTMFSKHPVQLKAGIFFDFKSRDFATRKIGIVAPRGTNNLHVTSLNDPVEIIMKDENFYYDPVNPKITGFAYKDGTDIVNTYQAYDELYASYVALKLPVGDFVDIYGGFRMESFNRLITGFYSKEHDSDGKVVNDSLDIKNDTINFFPSLNINFKLNAKNNLRFSYGKTINRPEFRENSVSYYEDFELNALIYGNPDLTSAIINNFDIRYEWYPTPGELISFSVFYKDFTNPIEMFQIPSGTKYVFIPFNTEKAVSKRIEFDMRKSLMFLDGIPVLNSLKHLTLVFNTCLIKSEITTDKSYARDSIRVMQGQSPYIINLGLFYNNSDKGFLISLNYNRVGKRIVFAGTPEIPHTWELPRNSVDLTINKKFGDHFEIKMGIKDLINDPIHWVAYFGPKDNTEVTKQSYIPNRKINLGLSWTF